MKRSTVKREPVCMFCSTKLPDYHSLLSDTPPHGEKMPGVGWSICGDDCSERPQGAIVFIRKRIGE